MAVGETVAGISSKASVYPAFTEVQRPLARCRLNARLFQIRTKAAQNTLRACVTFSRVQQEIVERSEVLIWLGGRDSNPDTVVQSHVSYRWTTSQLDATMKFNASSEADVADRRKLRLYRPPLSPASKRGSESLSIRQ
jgi:hypothetical protein